MSKARILPLLGPALVLYLIADVAAGTGALSLVAWAIALAALLCSLAPALARRRSGDDPGARRVGFLGVVVGVSLVAVVADEPPPPVVLSCALAAASAVGALVIDLGLSVPDKPRALDRGGWIRLLPALLSIVAGVSGLLAVAPIVAPFAVPKIVPMSWAAAPVGGALLAGIVALFLRASRRRMGSAPEALASNAWALLGLLLSMLAAGASVTIAQTGAWGPSSPWYRGLFAIGGVLLVVGHVATIDSRRRLSAGPALRRVVAGLGALGVVAGFAVGVRPILGSDPFTFGVFAIVVSLLGAAAYRVLLPVCRLLLAPDAGRLLAAVERCEELMRSAVTVEDVARQVLPPLRLASRDIEAMPLLFAFDPPRELRVDAAGEPHSRSAELPTALRERILDRPGEVVVRAQLEALVVRRPELRGVVDTLEAYDAICAVPLRADADAEGLLLVPRGRRRGSLTLEELEALVRLGGRVASYVAALSAQARAQHRAGRVDVDRKNLEEKLEDQGEELERLRTEARLFKAGRTADRLSGPSIAYGPAMRALRTRVAEVGPLDAPVLLVAEAGSSIDRIGHEIHSESGRAEGPFVIAEVASVRPERVAAALFGEEGEQSRPGWLQLGNGGTVLLVDAPALPLSVQAELAEAVSAHELRPVGSAAALPLDARIVATSRIALPPLVAAGAFDAELARWLETLTLRVPPLRERRQDIESLTLLALDRACRVFGRAPLGIEADALSELLRHEWPGNLRELQWVIDRAVARCEGPKVQRADLPPLVGAPVLLEDPLSGTYADLERRILVRALESAGGNKSEAARSLGLKRTTFLDKLRRHDIRTAVN